MCVMVTRDNTMLGQSTQTSHKLIERDDRKMPLQQHELNEDLFEAAQDGNLEECRRLILSGASGSSTDYNGTTPLHLAAREGHVDVCRYLVDKGADVSITDDGGFTPLHLAAVRGHVDVCRYLVDKGADVRITDDGGFTPLHWAAISGHVDVCRVLVHSGADVKVADSSAWTPLHYVAFHGRANVCRYLTGECNVDVNTTDQYGRSPLHWAASNGHADVCRALIQAGATVNSIDNDGVTPLDLAIISNKTWVLAYFYVHQVVKFDVVDHTGRMPWDRLNSTQRKALTKAMEDHKETEKILQVAGLPNELARLVMGYL